MLGVLRDLLIGACGCVLPGASDEELLRAELPANLKIIKRLGRGGEGTAFLVEETVWLSAEEQQLMAEEAAAEAEAAGADADAEDAVAAAAALLAKEEEERRRRQRSGGGILLKAKTALGIGGGAGGSGGATTAPPPNNNALAARSLPAPATTTTSSAPRMHKRQWALKAVRRGPNIDSLGLLAEIRNQARLGSHPNIVSLAEVLLTRHHLCLKMDVAAGGQLLDWICAFKPDQLSVSAAGAGGGDSSGGGGGGGGGSGAATAPAPQQPAKKQTHMPEPLARYFFVQLAHAVAHCHALRVAHRDLKLANVLLDDSKPPVVKLIDFGLSTTPALVAVRGGSGERAGRVGSRTGGVGSKGQMQAQQRGRSSALARSPSLLDRLKGASPERQKPKAKAADAAASSSSAAAAATVAAHPLPPKPLAAPAAKPELPPAPPPLRLGSDSGSGGDNDDDGSSGLSSPAIGASPRSWVAAAFGGTYDAAAEGGKAAPAATTTTSMMPPTALGAAPPPSNLPPSALGVAPPPAPAAPPSSLGSPFAALASGQGGAAAGMSPASSGPLGHVVPPALGNNNTSTTASTVAGGADSPPPRLLPRSNTAVGTPAYMAPELLSSIVQRGQERQQQPPPAAAATTATAASTSTIRPSNNALPALENPTTASAAAGHHHPEPADPSAVAPYDPYKVDVWALGCILFAMLTRRFPFAAGATGADEDSLAGLQAQLRAIKAARQPGERGKTHLRPGLWQELGVSTLVADLLDGMLTLDPAERFSLPKVLAHPWCRGVVPRTGGYAGALRRLAWLGAYRADEAAASAVVGGSSTGGSSDDGRTLSGGSPMWARSPSVAGGGGASPPAALGGGGGASTTTRGRAQAPSFSGGSPPSGASPRGASPTRLQRRSTAAATFSETLLQATATFRGLADEAAAAGAEAAAPAAAPAPTAAAPHHSHHHPRPTPLPAPVLSPECEQALVGMVTAAEKEGPASSSGRALRWRPRWRTPPPMVVAARPGPPVLKLPDAVVLGVPPSTQNGGVAV